MYYILTSKKKKKVLATENIGECFDFIYKNKDSKVRELDHTAKPRIIDRRAFLNTFLKITQNDEQTFKLAEIMIGGKQNLLAFLLSAGKKADFDKWKNINDKTL